MDNFLLKLQELEKTDSWNEATIYGFIHTGVSDLLSRDVQLLFQLLYRIDVNENLVKNIFSRSQQIPDIAHEISLLIMARLKQKAEIRRKYS